MPNPLRSRGSAAFVVVTAAALFALGLVNLVVNTQSPGSWAPLLILMPLVFFQGLRRVRRGSAGSANPTDQP